MNKLAHVLMDTGMVSTEGKAMHYARLLAAKNVQVVEPMTEESPDPTQIDLPDPGEESEG